RDRTGSAAAERSARAVRVETGAGRDLPEGLDAGVRRGDLRDATDEQAAVARGLPGHRVGEERRELRVGGAQDRHLEHPRTGRGVLREVAATRSERTTVVLVATHAEGEIERLTRVAGLEGGQDVRPQMTHDRLGGVRA